MECVQGGELFEHIKNTEISEREACLITHQTLEALQYLHMCGIVHRDLKPENIMVELDQDSGEVHQVKLTDFGLSKIIVPGEVMMESCGTPAYVGPEVLHKEGYGKEVDIWSTGVILYTMIARALPFHSQDKKRTFQLIKTADPDLESEIWTTISPECKDLIRKMLTKVPAQRITIDEALKHSWFEKYKDYISGIKHKYHPKLDEESGLIIKPNALRKSSKDVSVKISQMQLMMSMTDYAQQVDESSNSNKHQKLNMPESINPIGLFEHAKKNDVKPVRPLVGVRNSRVDAIRGGLASHGIKGTKSDPSRTFQPSKNFDFGAILDHEKQN